MVQTILVGKAGRRRKVGNNAKHRANEQSIPNRVIQSKGGQGGIPKPI